LHSRAPGATIERMGVPSTNSEYVSFACPRCHTRLSPSVRHVGRLVVCPDCGSKVRVPAPAAPRPEPERLDPGEYSVREAFDDAPPAPDDTFLMLCPKCDTRMGPHRRHVGKRAQCPDCRTICVIPAPPTAAPARHERRVGVYDVGASPERVGPPLELGTMPPLPGSGVPPPPLVSEWRDVDRPWRTSDLVAFLIAPDYLAWLFPTIGLSALMSLSVYAAAMMSQNLGGGATNIVAAVPHALLNMGFVVFGGILAGLTIALCGTGFWTITEDTAAGIIAIRDLPDAGFADWFLPGLRLVFLVALTAGIGFGFEALAWRFLMPTRGLPLCGTVLAAFPVLMVCALDTGTVLLPLSERVLGALVRRPHLWLLCLAQSGLLWGAWAAAVAALGFAVGWGTGACFGGVTWPLAMAIYGRMIGRLGWLLSQDGAPRRAAKRD
jgi:DNA-directed RNA polymerase subunit RPC12/RpoP